MPAYFTKTSIFRVGLKLLGADVGKKEPIKWGQLGNIGPAAISVLLWELYHRFISEPKSKRHPVEIWGFERRGTSTQRCKKDEVWWSKKSKDNWKVFRMMKPLPRCHLKTSHNGNVFVFPQKRESTSCHILGFAPKKHSYIFLLAQETAGQGTHTDGPPRCDSCRR